MKPVLVGTGQPPHIPILHPKLNEPMIGMTSTPSGLLSTGGMNMDPQMIEQLLAYKAFDRAKRKPLPSEVKIKQARLARKKARNHRKKFN